MYYLYFFQYDDLLFADILNQVIEHDINNLNFWKHAKKQTIENLENLHFYLYGKSSPLYPEQWCLSSANSEGLIMPELPILRGTNLQKINDLLDWMSKTFSWSILPWGGAMDFHCCVFITSQKKLGNQFKKLLIDMNSTFQQHTGFDFSNILIYEYEIIDYFSNQAQVAIINVLEDWGEFIWDVCQCDRQFPWVVTSDYYQKNEPSEAEKQQEIIEDYDITSPNPWSYHECKYIDCIKHPVIDTVEGQTLGIFEVHNRNLLKKMFRSYCLWETNTAICIPQGVNLNNLKNIIKKIAACEPESREFDCLSEILKTTPWYYGVTSDKWDSNYSVFITQDNAMIQSLEKFNLDNKCRVISYL
ncbi:MULTISPECIES: hypothetical protein [unclassified Roseofilum]|uniref:hypothetical protein n=1 Tax=unclassified Roseofilum TaxID=2620099 RepID=UPI001B0C5D51|nr:MULTISPECIES: hypothetical protein [unclassified Roseofilum]MBP0011471.1 hypothetical protein [Roseofilum sp. Belize Diploria]MBP0036025.1 hypothetical protein [Roseofilum sp. Belize BBD 4]